jgi:hypothetical protein
MTQKLVRARPKRVEELPEWSQCCDSMRRAAKENESRFPLGILMDTAQIVLYPKGRCVACKTSLPPIRSYVIAEGVHKGKAIAIEALDLDEGPIGSANA